jgi:hypothetical protein
MRIPRSETGADATGRCGTGVAGLTVGDVIVGAGVTAGAIVGAALSATNCSDRGCCKLGVTIGSVVGSLGAELLFAEIGVPPEFGSTIRTLVSSGTTDESLFAE